MRHELSDLSTNSHRKRDEHPAYAPSGVWRLYLLPLLDTYMFLFTWILLRCLKTHLYGISYPTPSWLYSVCAVTLVASNTVIVLLYLLIYTRVKVAIRRLVLWVIGLDGRSGDGVLSADQIVRDARQRRRWMIQPPAASVAVNCSRSASRAWWTFFCSCVEYRLNSELTWLHWIDMLLHRWSLFACCCRRFRCRRCLLLRFCRVV